MVFVHPDLGLGGAERLVVDAATGLKDRGFQVVMYTNHHDSSRAFEETLDGTLEVVVAGDFIPRNICGRFSLVCATLRILWLCLYVLLVENIDKVDAFFCDQIAVAVPFLKMSGRKVLFYCHFPDFLLTSRDSWIKKMYRLPLDYLESWATAMADVVLVNSEFTKSVVLKVWNTFEASNIHVLYPCINVQRMEEQIQRAEASEDPQPSQGNRKIILSINRFERKKNINLAILAYARLPENIKRSSRLIIAGGYDSRVSENVAYDLELRSLCDKLGLSISEWPDSNADVCYLYSFSDFQKVYLYKNAYCLIYTPSNEHFGIVPVESMYYGVPVIAMASGGPLETIVHEKTGLLCSDEDGSRGLSVLLENILVDPDFRQRMSVSAKERAIQHFSLDSFSSKLEEFVCQDLDDQ